MPPHTRLAKRVYNSTSLEVWFRYLSDPWEGQFSEDALERGREFYKTGLIQNLELTENDAIVQVRFARRESAYSVIERNADGLFDVRGSTGDRALAKAIAVAGLYELEELLIDELSPVAPDQTAKGAAATTADTLSTEPQAEETATDDEGPARKLSAMISANDQGLILRAFWLASDGGKSDAFGNKSTTERLKERESLVRLTARAHEAGFQFHRRKGVFTLQDPSRIHPFFSHTLPRWEASLGEVILTPEAAVFRKKPRDLRVIGQVEAEARDAMRVNWCVQLDNHWLGPELAEKVLRRGTGTHIIPGIGLAQIREDQAESLRDWQVRTAVVNAEAPLWPRYMMFSLFSKAGVELSLEKELEEWRSALTAKPEADDSSALPEALRDYQRQGVHWLRNIRAQACHGLLADEMGLGKTLQILSFIVSEHSTDKAPALIVCPASVVPVWESETARWFPQLRMQTMRAGVDFSSVAPDTVDVWIASYTQLRRHRHLLDEARFSFAILDEAQNIKNPDAKITQVCCAIRAETRFALTGTPLENRTLDLWALFRFLMPNLLGPRARFEKLAVSESAEERRLFLERLRTQLAPFILRRTKDDVLRELPPKIEINCLCPLLDRQKVAYETLLNNGREELGSDFETAAVTHPTHLFTLLTRLRQACCDPGLLPGTNLSLEHSGKVRSLLTRLREALEAQDGRKIVIFSQFVELLDRLRLRISRDFPDVPLFELSGKTRNRAKPVDSFQTIDGSAIFLISLKAGGTGITLHAADYVFLMDPWWNPAVENQAIDRVHRLGQEKPVFVYRLITQGTIEERIQVLQNNKQSLFDYTVGQLGGMKGVLEQFDDLESLAALLPSGAAPSLDGK